MANLFADPPTLAALAVQLQALVSRHPPPAGLRAWVVGCAGGEDAYACAMLLHEAASQMKGVWPLKVFATDTDPQLLTAARAGLYPAAQLEQLVPAQLQRFWFPTQGHYRVKEAIREGIIFASHQLLRDPPFTQLHLVICRDLFTALEPEQQVLALERFAFGLRPGGLLLLGTDLPPANRHFVSADQQRRLYVRRSASAPLPLAPRAEPAAPAVAFPRRFALPVEPAQLPALIVDEQFQILHLFEGAARFLRIGSGQPSHSLLDVVHPQLREAVRATLARAMARQRAAESPSVAVTIEGGEELVTIVVQPLPDHQGRGWLMVVFDITALGQIPPAEPLQIEDTRQHAAELATLRREHALILTQHDAAIEELRTANEELQIINEEHRVANEELEVRREELNTINEELSSLNQELSGKIEEISRINADLQNLIAASDIGTLFLDRELRVRRYTQQVEGLFNLIPADLGRPLVHLTHQLQDDRLLEDAQRLLSDPAPAEREVRHADGRWFLMRLRPYRAADHQIDGVVLTFFDISELRLVTEALRASEETLRQSHNELERRVQERTAELVEAQARLQRLLGALVRAQEDERQRLARELHDTLGQFLTALTLRLSVLQKTAGNPPELSAGLADLRRVAGQIDSELDRLTMELRPPALDDLGLEDALQEYAREWTAASGIPVDVLAHGLDDARPPAAVETTVYRIVQEALTNVSKHARAGRVSVILERRGDRLRTIIEDDGQGFDPETLEHQGRGGQQVGLLGMAERAALAGGELSIESAPGSGTTVYLHIPLAHAADADADAP